MQRETAKRLLDALTACEEIVHGYDSIDYLIVWKVATVDVPPLEIILTGLMDARDPDETWEEPKQR